MWLQFPEGVKYERALRDFDSVFEHARAVSTSIIGITPEERYLNYGEQIYVKMLAHCVSLRALAPSPDILGGGVLWDLPSMAAIARCIIESHDAFFYIAGQDVESAERAFRLRLWEMHDAARRIKMLEAIGSNCPQLIEIKEKLEFLQIEMKEDVFAASLDLEMRKKIYGNDPPAFHLSHRRQCESWHIDYDYYNAVTMQLSQYVHTYPHSVHQLFNFRAGSVEATHLITLPIQYSMPYIARVVSRMRVQHKERAPLPPSRTSRVMSKWHALAARGVKVPPLKKNPLN